MLEQKNGHTVHTPEKPDRFEFDADVSAIFPDMARRSIPNFYQAHQEHVAMADYLLVKPGCSVLDIGASRGAFYDAILEAGHKEVDYTAVDVSPHMCELLMQQYPTVNVLQADIASQEFLTAISNRKFDVVCCNYVLQFLTPGQQWWALSKIADMVERGGLFFLGHKSSHSGPLGELAHDRYIQFRVQNGYSEEEIRAKTAALKNSMFPMGHAAVMSFLRQRFVEVQETTRFMMFSTVAARA